MLGFWTSAYQWEMSLFWLLKEYRVWLISSHELWLLIRVSSKRLVNLTETTSPMISNHSQNVRNILGLPREPRRVPAASAQETGCSMPVGLLVGMAQAPH